MPGKSTEIIEFNLLGLSNDLWYEIGKFLPIKDRFRLRLVNRFFLLFYDETVKVIWQLDSILPEDLTEETFDFHRDYFPYFNQLEVLFVEIFRDKNTLNEALIWYIDGQETRFVKRQFLINMLLGLAAKYGYIDTFNLLLEPGRADERAYFDQALMMTFAHDRTEMVQSLLDRGATWNEALKSAAISGYSKAVCGILLKEGLTVDARKEALKLAVEFDQPETTQLLRNNGFFLLSLGYLHY